MTESDIDKNIDGELLEIVFDEVGMHLRGSLVTEYVHAEKIFSQVAQGSDRA